MNNLDCYHSGEHANESSLIQHHTQRQMADGLLCTNCSWFWLVESQRISFMNQSSVVDNNDVISNNKGQPHKSIKTLQKRSFEFCRVACSTSLTFHPCVTENQNQFVLFHTEFKEFIWVLLTGVMLVILFSYYWSMRSNSWWASVVSANTPLSVGLLWFAVMLVSYSCIWIKKYQTWCLLAATGWDR